MYKDPCLSLQLQNTSFCFVIFNEVGLCLLHLIFLCVCFVLREIKTDIQKWEDKVAALETLAAGSGVKAKGAKNQLEQG